MYASPARLTSPARPTPQEPRPRATRRPGAVRPGAVDACCGPTAPTVGAVSRGARARGDAAPPKQGRRSAVGTWLRPPVLAVVRPPCAQDEDRLRLPVLAAMRLLSSQGDEVVSGQLPCAPCSQGGLRVSVHSQQGSTRVSEGGPWNRRHTPLPRPLRRHTPLPRPLRRHTPLPRPPRPSPCVPQGTCARHVVGTSRAARPRGPRSPRAHAPLSCLSPHAHAPPSEPVRHVRVPLSCPGPAPRADAAGARRTDLLAAAAGPASAAAALVPQGHVAGFLST
jgi:hypothetical protein